MYCTWSFSGVLIWSAACSKGRCTWTEDLDSTTWTVLDGLSRPAWAYSTNLVQPKDR